MREGLMLERRRWGGAVIMAGLLAVLLFSEEVVFGFSLAWGMTGLLHLPEESVLWLAPFVVGGGVLAGVWIFRTAYAAEIRNRAEALTAVDDTLADAGSS